MLAVTLLLGWLVGGWLVAWLLGWCGGLLGGCGGLLNVPTTCYVSQGRICSDNFTYCHTEIQVADQTTPSHSILTPGQPVPALTYIAKGLAG